DLKRQQMQLGVEMENHGAFSGIAAGRKDHSRERTPVYPGDGLFHWRRTGSGERFVSVSEITGGQTRFAAIGHLDFSATLLRKGNVACPEVWAEGVVFDTNGKEADQR